VDPPVKGVLLSMLPFFRKSNPEEKAQMEASNSVARANLLWKQGSRMLERKKYDRAIDAMREAYELEPSRLAGRLNLGAALYLTQQFEEAIGHFRYVLAFDQQNTMALLNLAASYDALGQADMSIETLEHLVERRPGWRDAHYNLAVAYFKNELYLKAAKALQAELKINPEHDLARQLMNKIHLLPPDKRPAESEILG
jgi:tetratricopeptide (TPR) repeat protein